MTNEQLRMQMLSGIITEGQYKAKLQENADKASLNESMIGGIVGVGAINQIPPRAKADYEMAFEHFLGERIENQNQDPSSMEEGEEEVEEAFDSPKDTNPVVQGYLKQLTDILNTQTDDMFDLKNLKYAVDKFSDMVNDEITKFEVEEGKEVEEGNQNDWWVKADEELGLDFDGDDLEDLLNSDESWQAAFAKRALAINSDNYEDYKNQISAIYDKTNPF